MPQGAQPLIEFIGVSKFAKDKQILRDINLSIYPGDIFGLIGTSGAGKSSLLKALIGFYVGGIIALSFPDLTIQSGILYSTKGGKVQEQLTKISNIYVAPQAYNIALY